MDYTKTLKMEHKKSEKIMENIVKTIAVDEKLSLFLFDWIYQVPKEREKREKNCDIHFYP